MQKLVTALCLGGTEIELVENLSQAASWCRWSSSKKQPQASLVLRLHDSAQWSETFSEQAVVSPSSVIINSSLAYVTLVSGSRSKS